MNYSNFVNYINNYKRLLINTILSLLLIYFVFHSFYGNRGIISYFTLSQKLQKSYSELESLRAERVELEHKVKLLRPESLDQDMLDQEARRVLGIASPKEQVFTDNSLK
jgi:cell division protein FtsB